MKKLLLLITIVSISIFGCPKSDKQSPNILIAEARDYFETEVRTNKAGSSPSPEGITVSLPDKTPDWNKANVQDLKFGATVVVPLSIPDLYTSCMGWINGNNILQHITGCR